MAFKYHWIHTPTGKEEMVIWSSDLPDSELAILQLINKWNRLGQGKWVYWLEAIE